MSRKHISLKTKLCAALMLAYNFDYKHAKALTEDQFLSLFDWDHNIFYSSGHEDRDRWWNLTPMWIPEHREKTKHDAKIIAKSRRIRAKNAAAQSPVLRTGPDELGQTAYGELAAVPRPARPRGRPPIGETAMTNAERQQRWRDNRKLRSRGFDKRFRKKMDGTVVKR